MTMTNPDKPITKQDLNDYHNAILPYLGGMPEIYANKFAKGDLYDTNEKMIGKWIDGRPLYQKTVDCGALPNSTSKNVAHGISNLNYVVSISGMILLEGGDFTLVPKLSDKYMNNQSSLTVDSTYVTMENRDKNLSGCSCIVTLKYTKTTDQANSFNFGNTTDYSTDEKIVGTWIDGSYLYQKTYDFGVLPNNTGKTLAYNIPNLGQVIELYGITFTTSGTVSIKPLPASGGEKYQEINLELDGNDIKIETYTDRSNWYAYVTILYTKSST